MSCHNICIGDLNKKIEIIDKSYDITGCLIDYLTPIRATVWAKIQTISSVQNGVLIFNDTNINNVVSHKFTIRYRNDINGDDIIKYDNRYFTIQSVSDINEDKKWAVVYAIERGNINNDRNIF